MVHYRAVCVRVCVCAYEVHVCTCMPECVHAWMRVYACVRVHTHTHTEHVVVLIQCPDCIVMVSANL